MNPAVMVAAGLVGGGLSATSHLTKAGSRLMINTSPEPVTNWTASITEDIAVFAGLWAALNHPSVFLAMLILFLIFVVWVMPKIYRFIKAMLIKISAFFKRSSPQLPPPSA